MKTATLAFLAAATACGPAWGQAQVVSACGTTPIAAGGSHYLTVDTNGGVCSKNVSATGCAPTLTAGGLHNWVIGSNGVAGTNGTACGNVVGSTWSAADAITTGMTLSNGGLTVDTTLATQTSQGWSSIRYTLTHTTGKYYIEFFANTTDPTSDGPVFGLAASTFNVADGWFGQNGISGGAYYSFTYAIGGFVAKYNITNIPTSGSVVALAIDCTAGKLWIAYNNIWVNGSSPAAGSLPILTFPTTLGVLSVGMSFGEPVTNSYGSDIWTIRPTAAQQTYAPPTGFTPWN